MNRDRNRDVSWGRWQSHIFKIRCDLEDLTNLSNHQFSTNYLVILKKGCILRHRCILPGDPNWEIFRSFFSISIQMDIRTHKRNFQLIMRHTLVWIQMDIQTPYRNSKVTWIVRHMLKWIHDKNTDRFIQNLWRNFQTEEKKQQYWNKLGAL